MESYKDLKLNSGDKVPKISFFAKIFKRDTSMSKEHLDFLDEQLGGQSPKEDVRGELEEDFGSPALQSWDKVQKWQLKNFSNFQTQNLQENLQETKITQEKKEKNPKSFKPQKPQISDLPLQDLLLQKKETLIPSNLLETKEAINPQTSQISKNLNEDLKKENLSEKNLEAQVSINASEKEAILDDVLIKEDNISFRLVCIMLGLMLFVLALFIPKIYIRNNIYYTSRNIIQLQAQLDSLNEENKYIKKQLEDIKFHNLTQELDF